MSLLFFLIRLAWLRDMASQPVATWLKGGNHIGKFELIHMGLANISGDFGPSGSLGQSYCPKFPSKLILV